MFIFLKKFLLILSIVAIAGCNGVPVVRDVTQRQANEIVASLTQYGISAVSTKGTGSKSKYDVEVRRENYSQAITILNQEGLPRERPETFADLVSQRGFLPSSREIESLRVDHAMSVQLEEMLGNHPQIVSIKVIARVKSVAEGSEPSVSVVIEERESGAVDLAEFRQAISKAIPGMKSENIFISAHKFVQNSLTLTTDGSYNTEGKLVTLPLVPFLGMWRIPEDDYTGVAWVLIGSIALMFFIGGVIGFWYGSYHRSKDVFENELPDASMRSLKLDRNRKELPDIGQ